MKKYLFVACSITFLSAAQAHAFGKKPVTLPPPSQPPLSDKGSCPAAGTAQAVDISEPIDQPFLDAMKKINVQTVVRYYDQVNETLAGKTLRPAERDLLARNGFDLVVVFQHNNNQITSFTTARGTSDATRSLSLAATNRQPAGSAIYFGVDGDWGSTSELAAIKAYFGKAAPLVRAAGFKMGAYGSGLACTELMKAGLIDHCWLANATSWPGYSSFLATNTWAMKQGLPRDCGGKNVDFDVANPAIRDLGQFRP
ncbi:MAG: glycoside hydrolase domain-containing protein [Bdellovibrionota bacterium]